MKILIVHQYFLMPGQGGGSRFNEMARMWTDAGHDVEVIAGTVDYTNGERPERYRGKWISREYDGAARVWRCHVSPAYQRGALGRMWAFAVFTLSATTAALLTRRPDIVVATSPPLTSAIPGWIAARWRVRRVPWIFEIRDLWPESAVTTGVLRKDSAITRFLYGLERWACRRANAINVLTPAFRDDLLKRGLAPADKIAFLPNSADLRLFQPGARDNEVRRSSGWGDRFVVMYAGAHGKANAVGQLVAAAERLSGRPDILIACVGDGPERPDLEARVRAARLTNIVFHGPQPKNRMPDFVNAADVGAAVLQNNPTFRTVYPNKVFDYMACARPVLLAIDGVARKLVCEEAGAGVFAEPENPGAIADAITTLADSPELRRSLGDRGHCWVVENASRERIAQRYLDLMHRIAENSN